MLHGHNPTQSTKQCRTIKRGAEKHKKTCENGDWKNNKCAYTPTKEDIHTLAAFDKYAMAKECNNVNKELTNFQNISMSGDKKDG